MKGEMGTCFSQRFIPESGEDDCRFRGKRRKTILITEPFILTTSKRWQEAVDNKVLGTDQDGKPFTYDFYFGNTGLVDVFKPEAQEWFWKIYKGLINKGVGGWWGDL